MDGQCSGDEASGEVKSAFFVLASIGLLVLSQSPYSFGHLAGIALVPWLLVTMRAAAIRALLIGGGFGIAHAILGSFWIFDALGGQGLHGGRKIFVAIAMACWAKGVIFAATGWVVWVVRSSRYGLEGNLALALLAPAMMFGLVEFWMSHSPWGLPLMLLGHSQSTVPGIRQLAVAIGVPGISAFLFALNLSIAMALRGGARHRIRALALVLSWMVALASGQPVAEMFAADDSNTSERSLLVVQPHIDPRDRWEMSSQFVILEETIEETSRAIEDVEIRPNVILWPESLLTFPFSPEDPLGRRLQDQVDSWNVPVVLGLVRAAKRVQPNGRRLYRNSVVWWSPLVGPVDWEDKVRAIPIVESSRGFFGIGNALSDWAFRGATHAPRVAEGIKAEPLRGEFTLSPALCFEILFPGIVSDRRDEDSVAIVNLADDNWVKGEAVDKQIIASATFRAIEQRLTMVRVSNGGVSVAIDRYGRRIAELPVGEFGHMVVGVRAMPRAAMAEKVALVVPPMAAAMLVLIVGARGAKGLGLQPAAPYWHQPLSSLQRGSRNGSRNRGSGAESIGEWIRLMRELGLHRVMPRKFRVKTHSDHKHPIAKNVLDRNLKALRAEPEMDCRYHVHLLGERGLGSIADFTG
ncbi:MAG: apolipoprotein N-acyltransferase [Myxococcales bacterium]|nr:apolipoprotein N-acyltransferase [Myxococcales bacterium]HIK85695.1 apolipoprotein N-acyltransferase [Myxococcales bacterium]